MAPQKREASQIGERGPGVVNGSAANGHGAPPISPRGTSSQGTSPPGSPPSQAFVDVHSEQTSPWAQPPSRANGRTEPPQGTLAHAAALAWDAQPKHGGVGPGV